MPLSELKPVLAHCTGAMVLWSTAHLAAPAIHHVLLVACVRCICCQLKGHKPKAPRLACAPVLHNDHFLQHSISCCALLA